ncbi:MAG: wax ester/triacylglycerol synthase family O-acyltransferase [Deltaproteobacteria bacterium]|nr:wax ester/triacylglycerol synthase family O-acyltransferase [Deltaproteobacteria bacterium]MBW2696813.1 wax ester/triacylglycerol synthase family O-acyltransferase [Deltaproteobacteria bacterium]
MAESKPPHVMHFDDRMSAADALMWHLESDPILRSTILSTWILDRMPDLSRLEAKAERATRIIPRLRQRVVVDPLGLAPPKWEDDPHFDMRFHFRRSALPGPGSIRDLLDLAEPMAMQAFDKDRPLWELHLIEGLEGGRCAVIMKLHHAISDGVGLVKMTECLVERGPEDQVDVAPLPVGEDTAPKAEPSAWDRVGDALAYRLRDRADKWRRFGASIASNAVSTLSHPIDTASEIGRTLASAGRVLAPASEPLSPIMLERSTAVRFEYLRIPLAELKRAGKAVGGSVNDAFVAGVAGGLARYHTALGAPVESLRMLMPVNVRGGEKADHAGNQFAPARFEVPVGIESPAARIREIGKLCREQRDEPALPWIEEITSLLGALPPALTNGLFGAMQKTTDFTTSNVRGPRHTTWMSGARVEGFMPFGPLAGAGANVTVFSYDGVMHVGINMDPAAVSEPKLFLECLEKGFEEVLTVVE